MTEKEGEKFVSEVRHSQLPATQTKLYSKDQIKSIFSWTADLKKVTKANQFLFLNSFHAVYAPSILITMHFQQLRFMRQWSDAEGSCTFQTCRCVLP